AHAINDEGIAAAYGELAKLIAKPVNDEQLMLRVINANFRSGNAATLAAYAADEAQPEKLRVEALGLLGTWAKPFARDRVVGVFRPLPDRDPKPAFTALGGVLSKLLTAKSGLVQMAAVEAVAALGGKSVAPALLPLTSRT